MKQKTEEILEHIPKKFKNGPHQNKKQHPAASHYLSRGKKAGVISEPHGNSRAQPVGKQEPAGNINRLATGRSSARASPLK